MKVNRTMAVLTLAVLAPGLALCVLQYRSLVELEAKTKASARERMHEVLGAAAREVTAKLQQIAGDALNPIAAQSSMPAREREASFAALRRAEAAILEVLLTSECACQGEPIDVYSSGTLTVSGKRLEHRLLHPILQARAKARGASGTIKYFQPGDSPLIHAFRELDGARQIFAGVTIDARAVLQQILARPATEAITFSVADAGNRRIWGDESGAQPAEGEVRFGPPATDWTLQGRYRGTTVQLLAQRQFQRGVGLMALVVICLMAGTVLTVRAANREARAAAERSAFIANISHEMKTPLALIRMFAETLELGRVKDPGRLAEYYRTLHRESRKLTGLIENVLEFGRMEAGRREYRMEAGSVAEIVGQVMCSFEPQLRAGGFTWRTEIGEDLPMCRLDAVALAQAIGNMVDNAIKYSTEVRNVEVSAGRREGEVVITIMDSGIGIPASEQERIFDRFYRASAPLVHNTKGSGLGLAIARHIVEAHGGHMQVESTVGKGSRFLIALPAAAAQAESEGAEACLRS